MTTTAREDEFAVADAPFGRDVHAWIVWANELAVSRHLALECTDLGADCARFRVERAPLRNSRGWIHGAALLGVFDQCAGIALVWTCSGVLRASTVTLSARFLRPARGSVAVEARVIQRGRTLAFVEAVASGSDGRPCARADVTFALRRLAMPSCEQAE
jgi:acyl-coenzyme A thioesterase PaaI-like protein